MSKLKIPEKYASPMSLYETQNAIGELRTAFEGNLSNSLNLCRVSAPLFVAPETGLNDDLNGVERPVEFDVAETGANAQIVHSLAKWKRFALHKYGFPVGKGLYTDMNAIRADEVLDNLIDGVSKQINHISIYVKRLLEVMETGVTYTTNELMELLDMKSRISFRENYLVPAIDNGVVKMTFPDTPTSKNQTYYKD